MKKIEPLLVCHDLCCRTNCCNVMTQIKASRAYLFYIKSASHIVHVATHSTCGPTILLLFTFWVSAPRVCLVVIILHWKDALHFQLTFPVVILQPTQPCWLLCQLCFTFLSFLLSVCICVNVCACMNVCMPQCLCTGRRTAGRSQFSLTRESRIKLRLSGLVANTLTY